ncbi:PREDICTED: olfactory receptor 11L1-like [Lepidothrix coronata]|uniref:Olfactory receptor n=1 Tax=Lepidothrix coronata TaxID=321398 RepID=A0A6J0I8B6_9PASS|nr:PREDICTED: olfactory receptor 11L1-like [Lepidothrix coronata]
MTNVTAVLEFKLLGFSSNPHCQILLFMVVMVIYILTILGNIIIILVVKLEPKLHSPMFRFLQNLSFLEVCYTTTIVPKMLSNLLAKKKSISFSGCMAQLYYFVSLGITECYLLAAMAYDRFLAVCQPLQYSVVMTDESYTRLAVGSWVTGVFTGVLPCLMISRLHFCSYNLIDHFFCDISPLLKLSCSDTTVTEAVIFMISLLVLPSCFLLTLVSYLFIILTILKIPSASGKRVTFSTCSSHLMVVTIYYGTTIFIYVRPTHGLSSDLNKAVAVLYTVVTPLLNPVIYSLRNKAFQKALEKTLFGHHRLHSS